MAEIRTVLDNNNCDYEQRERYARVTIFESENQKSWKKKKKND